MIYVGTSGYGYHDWSPSFYPTWLCHEDYLDFYADRFNCCELNFSYYRMPAEDDFDRLLHRSAGRLMFTVRTHRRLTHQREKSMGFARRFATTLTPLIEAERLGAVVAQFPFSYINNPDHRSYVCRLRDALSGLPFVAEFRHESWFSEETLDFLRGWGVGAVCADTPELAGLPGPRALATTELGYVRFHGRNDSRWWKWWKRTGTSRYDYNYRRRELLGWVPRLREIERHSRSIFVIFNNHWRGQAVGNAQVLAKILDRNRNLTANRRHAVAERVAV